MEFEPIANISANETFDTDETFSSSRENILDLPILLAAAAGTIADLIIVYTILRNKELRTRSNIYIVNFCVCNVFYFLFTPLIIDIFSVRKKVPATVICFTTQLLFLFMLGSLVFICILLLDWYIVTYKSLNASARCRASYKIVLSTVWATLCVFSLSIFLECTAGVSFFFFLATVTIIFYFFSFIFVALICIMKVINERTTSVIEAKSNTDLLYVISYFLCWLPNWIFIYIIVIASSIMSAEIVGSCTYIIGYLHSVVLLYIIYRKDEKFRDAIRKWMFDEGKRSVEEDSHENDVHFTTLL